MVVVQAQGENTGNLPVCEVQVAVLWQKYHRQYGNIQKHIQHTNCFASFDISVSLLSLGQNSQVQF